MKEIGRDLFFFSRMYWVPSVLKLNFWWFCLCLTYDKPQSFSFLSLLANLFRILFLIYYLLIPLYEISGIALSTSRLHGNPPVTGPLFCLLTVWPLWCAEQTTPDFSTWAAGTFVLCLKCRYLGWFQHLTKNSPLNPRISYVMVDESDQWIAGYSLLSPAWECPALEQGPEPFSQCNGLWDSVCRWIYFTLLAHDACPKRQGPF